MDPLAALRRASVVSPPPAAQPIPAVASGLEKATGPLAGGIPPKDTTEQLSKFIQAGRAAKGFKIFDDDKELQSLFVDNIDMSMDSEQSIREWSVRAATPFLERAFRGC